MANSRFLQFILLVATVTCCGGLRAEDGRRSHNVSVRFMGASNIISVNYDTRFPGSSVFGYRAGLGFSLSYMDKGSASVSPGVFIPLGVNAILGKRASKFEAGVEFAPGLYAWRNSRENYWIEGDIHHSQTIYYGSVHWSPSFEFSLNLGYRLQRKKGFYFRAGISPCVCVNSSDVYINALSLLPYLSFGYTFQ